MNKKGFTLVELMVVVAIVAILAAVALPMYSTFKQKGKVSTAIKSITGLSGALQNWYEDKGTFSGIWTVSTTGGKVELSGVKVGAGLPEIQNMNWYITGDASTITVSFSFVSGSGCPPTVCNGSWQMICCSLSDKCVTQYRIGRDDEAGALGLDKDFGTIPDDCN